MMGNYNYTIIEYKPEYKKGVLELLEPMWNEYEKDTHESLFAWRYENNPYGVPVIFLALDKNAVVGFRSFIAQKFLLKNQEYLVYSPSDTIIHPDYRRLGIISALNNVCIDKMNQEFKDKKVILLNTSTSKPSMPVYLKQKWQKTNGLRQFYFRFSISNYLKKPSESIDKIDENSIVITKGGFTIEVTNILKTTELRDYNKKIRNIYKWTNVRDEDFFKWRYSFLPEKYTCVYCYQNNRIVGYTIVSRKIGSKYSLDQFEANNPKVFALMIKAVLKHKNIQQLRTYAFTIQEKKMMKSALFIAEPVRILKLMKHLRFPVLVRPIQPEPNNNDFLIDEFDIRKIENWHLQLSDRH